MVLHRQPVLHHRQPVLHQERTTPRISICVTVTFRLPASIWREAEGSLIQIFYRCHRSGLVRLPWPRRPRVMHLRSPPMSPPSGTSPTASVARAPFGSESKYSYAKMKERIAADGSVVPVSEPKKTKNGLYQRPVGRTRKGMEWDAGRGIWVPQQQGYWGAPLSKGGLQSYQPPLSLSALKHSGIPYHPSAPSDQKVIKNPYTVLLSNDKSSAATTVFSRLSPQKMMFQENSIAIPSREIVMNINTDQTCCATLPPKAKPGDQFAVVWPTDKQKYGVTCPESLTTETSSDKAQYLCVVQPPQSSHQLPPAQFSISSPRRSQRERKGMPCGYSVMSRSPGNVWREYSKSSSRKGMEYQVSELPSCKNWDQQCDEAAPR